MTVLDEVNAPVTRRLGVVAKRVQDFGHGAEQPLSVFLTDGVVPRSSRSDNHNELGSDLEKYQLVQPGDLVFNRLRAWQGGFGASVHRGVVSPAYIVVRPTGADARYLNYVMHSEPYLAELVRISKWMPPSQFDVLWSDLRQVPVPWIDLEDQRRIADFLDDRVARIDQVITARRAQVSVTHTWAAAKFQELFEELIAEHGQGRLGYLIRGLEQGWSPQAESAPAGPQEWGVMRAGCVNGGVFRADDNKRLPKELEPQRQYEIRSGDLLMSRASGSLDLIGSVAMVPLGIRDRLLLCDKVYRITPLPEWLPEYLAPMMRTYSNREVIRLGVSGAEGMANNLPSGVVRSLRIPLASRPAQAEAAAAAQGIEKRQVACAEAIEHSVDLLQEYKQSLITAAVTGELDVTTAGSGIPG